MANSHLIQRLQKPNFFKKADGAIVDNPWVFGGGLRNGGINPKAMEMLRPIFGFDYMGAAEFEFGAVPEALQKMSSAELVTANVTVETSADGYVWKDGGKKGTCSTLVYVLCQKEHLDEVTKRIQTMGDERKLNTHERVGLEDSIRLIADGKAAHTLGWLEINNGYMFFVDKEMWKKTCALFGIKER
jgi:hypothetical protein